VAIYAAQRIAEETPRFDDDWSLLSITHSARCPLAASVASARLDAPCSTIPAKTWVAQMTGTWAASQSHKMFS